MSLEEADHALNHAVDLIHEIVSTKLRPTMHDVVQIKASVLCALGCVRKAKNDRRKNADTNA